MHESYATRPVILHSTDEPQLPQGQCDCDGGDCACSLPLLASPDGFVPTPPPSERLKRSPGSQSLSLDSKHYILYGPFHKPAVLNESALKVLTVLTQPDVEDANLQQLIDLWGYAYVQTLIKAYYSLGLVLSQSEQPSLIIAPQTLSVWMHVTDRCNLRCEYCYLPHLKQDMSEATGFAAIDASLRSASLHNYKELKLKYAGGEPLLRFETVLSLHSYALRQGAAQGINIDGVVLSNGTLLTKDKAIQLREQGLRLMISLDGLGEIHNAQRPYASGRNTFEDVVRGIETAIAGGIVPDISVTATGKSAPHLPQIIEWILDHRLPFSLNFYRENERSVTYADLRLEEETIITGMLAAYEVIEQRLPRRSLLGSLVDRANLSGAHLKTCGVGDNYMVFDYKGRVSKCQMVLHRPVTTVDVQDPLAVVRADQIGLQNLSVEEKEGCKGCEWKYWCTGGCSLATFRATGRYDINSPNCHIYKTLYPQAMKIEGLRIMRYGQEMAIDPSLANDVSCGN